MWKTNKLVWISGLALALVAVAGLVSALDIPKNKEDIKLSYIDGKKGDVKFPHKKHATEFKVGDKAIACKTCHHTLKGEPKTVKDVQKCSACHVAEGTAQKEHGGKKAPFFATKKGDKYDQKTVIFHDACKKCHTKVGKVGDKNIKACKTCHQK